MNANNAPRKETKMLPENLVSGAPYNRSINRNDRTASKKKEKYIIPAKARITDTQKGKNNREKRSIITARILSAMYLSYREASFDARPV